jgi:hypothetical protein
VRRDPVEEPPVVGHDHGTARELEQSVLQRPERFNVQVVRRLVKQQHVATNLECQRQIQPVPLTTGKDSGRLLLIRTLKAEGRNVRPTGHFDVTDVEEVQAIGNDLPHRFLGVDARSVLVDIGQGHRLADAQ